MRIGVDARLLSEPVNGIGRYSAELSRELVKLEKEFYFYTPKPPMATVWEGNQYKLRSSAFHGRIGKILWSQTMLPYWAVLDKIDLFWGTTHRLPRYLPASMARVVTIHDLVWKFAGETMRPLSRWMERFLMPEAILAADRIMTDSQSTADALASEFPLSRSKIRIVPLGVTRLASPSNFSSLSTLGINRPYFLFVGTLEPRKNLRRLLSAFASIRHTLNHNALLVIAGGKGWGAINVQNVVHELNLERNVVLTGYVTDSQLSTLYAHARFLAMPSLHEGFGLPLIEAMSYGVPVLTSDLSSLPEVAGNAGILINPLDEKALAAALVVFLNNDKRRDELAAHAAATAAKYTWEKAALQTMEVFSEALTAREEMRRSCT